MTVRQTQTGEPSASRSASASRRREGVPPRVQRVEVTDRESTFTLPADTEPVSVVLDPGVWLLADFGRFTKTAANQPR